VLYQLWPAIAKGRHSHNAIAIARATIVRVTVRIRTPLALFLTLVAYRKVWRS